MSIITFILALLIGAFSFFAGCTDTGVPVDVVTSSPVGTYAGQMEIATGDNEFLTITVEEINDAGIYPATISVQDSDEVLTMDCTYSLEGVLDCAFQDDPDDETLYFIGYVTGEGWDGTTELFLSGIYTEFFLPRLE